MKTIIKNTTAFVGENLKRQNSIDILIEKDLIKKIGKNISSASAKTIDGKDFFITPGFVNAHFHPSQQLNRALGVGISHDKQMDLLHASDTIKQPDDKLHLSYIAVLEGLKAGTTCFYSVGSEIDTQVEIYNNLGISTNHSEILSDILEQSIDKRRYCTAL